MLDPRRPTVDSRLIELLEKNLAVLERLTDLLGRLQLAPTPRSAGLLSQADLCAILQIGSDTLKVRIRQGKFPRPAFGAGARALWRIEDLKGVPGLNGE